MLMIHCNRPALSYDVHSLVKAFYPEKEVKVITPDSVLKDVAIAEAKPDMVVDIQDDKAEVIFYTLCGDSTEYTLPEPYEKNTLKLFLYDALCDVTGKELPWGNLTGIRPTKIAMTLMNEGKTEAEVKAYMKDTHKVSDEKIALSIDIAKRENALLQTLHCENGYSVYMGIPFCPTTCLYCSFTSFPICVWQKRVGEYLDAMEKELRYTADAFRDKVLDTVYIGGGTPSSLAAEDLDRLLAMTREILDFDRVMEFTVEAGRADSITREKLQVMKKYGVTRISVNPQTMKQDTLDLIGRRHTVEQVKEAFRMAREEGFDNINMDIILGLPGEDEADVANTIEEIKNLNPESLTVHSLAIKRASKLANWIRENGISTLHNTDKTMEIARQGALSMGMKPYYLYRQKNMAGNFENVGYAKDFPSGIPMGCVYNSAIMEEVQTIVACGAGTISKRVYPDGRIERCENVKDVGLYIEKIEEMIERKRKMFAE